ncbi:MAG: GNAT family N-acetyltransferase [Sphingomonadales bacterium]|nr:GNAT family N-acetyltransferase [Sphingomonadales bacterium]MBD3774414.1 GNAT family N-acetyltransferase [Paracoccaceae bacterium]
MGGQFGIETERLVLREWREDDWPEFFRVTNTPAVMRWLGGVLDEAGRAKQHDRVMACHARNGFCFWPVFRKADGGHLAGELLGFCGIKRADASNCTVTGEFEIGWRLREEAWGQGYAREAAQAVLEASFTRFGAEEIFALTIVENEGSWGLMRRLGMRRRADLDFVDPRYASPWCDTIMYSITREEWRAGIGA